MQQPQPRLIICRGFALGLFEPDTDDIGGVFEVDEFELMTELRFRLGEYFHILLRADIGERRVAPLANQRNRHVAGTHSTIVSVM